MEKKKIKSTVIVSVIAVILFITLLSSVTIVEAGHAGIVLKLGAVQSATLDEGLHFRLPYITSIVKMNVRTQIAEATCTAASRDLQTITTTVAINYHADKAQAADLYKRVALGYEVTLIQPALQESVKAVTARFSAEEMITKRQEVSGQIKEELAKKISPYGLVIEIFNITNLEFSAEFNSAIEAKQTAQQNALKAEQDLARIKMEAQQEIEKAKAEAESLRIKREQITEQMLRLEWIKKWDGKLPIVSGSDGNILDINALMGQ